MKITSKGQVTIPVEIREKLGLLPNTEAEFVVEGNTVRIRPRPDRAREGRGARVVGRLRGTGTVRMSTDEILALTRKP
ncbi:MAG: AbrB/MazE/SpoVT family DNA-binding domain-containing protein [Actinomycetota bacterium]